MINLFYAAFKVFMIEKFHLFYLFLSFLLFRLYFISPTRTFNKQALDMMWFPNFFPFNNGNFEIFNKKKLLIRYYKYIYILLEINKYKTHR